MPPCVRFPTRRFNRIGAATRTGRDTAVSLPVRVVRLLLSVLTPIFRLCSGMLCYIPVCGHSTSICPTSLGQHRAIRQGDSPKRIDTIVRRCLIPRFSLHLCQATFTAAMCNTSSAAVPRCGNPPRPPTPVVRSPRRPASVSRSLLSWHNHYTVLLE